MTRGFLGWWLAYNGWVLTSFHKSNFLQAHCLFLWKWHLCASNAMWPNGYRIREQFSIDVCGRQRYTRISPHLLPQGPKALMLSEDLSCRSLKLLPVSKKTQICPKVFLGVWMLKTTASKPTMNPFSILLKKLGLLDKQALRTLHICAQIFWTLSMFWCFSPNI